MFNGPAHYRAVTRWPPLAAVAAGIAITAAALIVASSFEAPAPADTGPGHVVPLLTMQAVTLVLTVAAAGLLGDRPADVLALRAPAAGWRLLLPALLLTATLALASSLVTILLTPEMLRQDLAPLRALMAHEPSWMVMAMIAVGAPLAEEVLFRGFLFSALACSAIGIGGAVVVTTTAWTLMHAGYSLSGLAEVAIVGLLFCWLLVRTGSLWVPIICHAAHNATVLLILPWLPG